MSLRLVTIPFSHFCEKARWGLDRAGVVYAEDGHLPMLAWLPAWRAGGRRTVPVLVTGDDDGAIADSTDILRWCDRVGDAAPLFPEAAEGPWAGEVAALEDELDRSFGPATRRVGYAALLPDREVTSAMMGAAPRWQAGLVRATYPAVRAIMTRGLRLDAASVARSAARVDEWFARIGALLADGRRYLVGDRFTAADLTFAALATPVLLPDAYLARMPTPPRWPAALAATVARLRATAAGAFALRLYAEER